MKKVIVSFAASMLCGLAFATDSYTTIRHAQITPTNRVVTSIPTWAQSDTPPAVGGITTNDVGIIATNTVDAKVAPWAMNGQPQPTGSITTNDVNAIIASSNLQERVYVESYSQWSLNVSTVTAMNESTWEYKTLYVKIGRQPEFNTGLWNPFVTISTDSSFSVKTENHQCEPSGPQIMNPDATSITITIPMVDIGGVTYSSISASTEIKMTRAFNRAYCGSKADTTPTANSTNLVTSGGAKAYADATFLPLDGTKSMHHIYFSNNGDLKGSIGVNNLVNKMWIITEDDYILFGNNSSDSRLYPDESDIATSNMVERVIASKPAPSPLTGKTYDFANGSNFTKRVYTALTNVIQTLGGTVTNPPAFN